MKRIIGITVLNVVVYSFIGFSVVKSSLGTTLDSPKTQEQLIINTGNSNTSEHGDTGSFNISTQIVTNLDVAVTQDLEFRDITVPDAGGASTKTLAADEKDGIAVVLNGDRDETVSVVLSGTGVDDSNHTYTKENGVTVVFNNSLSKWSGIGAADTFYIGGTMTVDDSATGDTSINENITLTVTYESIN